MSKLTDKLKEYSPKDWEQFKMTGLGKILFQYLMDSLEDNRRLTLLQFDGCEINEQNLSVIKNRQMYAACLRDILNLELQNIKDYYEGKENG